MKKQSAMALAILMMSMAACSSTSSSRGNGESASGVNHNVSGQVNLTAGPAALAALGLNKNTSAPTASCPASAGTITVKALTGASGVAAVEDQVDSEGNFSLSLDTTLTWYVEFFQGSGSSATRCAELIMGPAADKTSTEEVSQQGKSVVIPKGTSDVNLGTIVDLGDGKMSPENPPALPTDFDTKDIDHNGIYDYAEGQNLDEGQCDIVDIYPTDGDFMYVFPSDVPADDGLIIGQMFFTTNNPISASGLDGSGIRVYELDTSDTEPVIDGFDVSDDIQHTTDFLAEFAPGAGFLEFGSYRLTIDAGAITCDNGHSNPDEISVDFVTVPDSYYDETFQEALRVQR